MRGLDYSDSELRLGKMSPAETYKLWDVPFFHFNVVLLDLFILTNTSALCECSKSVKLLQCLKV